MHRSLPAAISACYDLWKQAYAENKMVKKYYLVFDFGYTCSNVYLVGIQRVGNVMGVSFLASLEDQVSLTLEGSECACTGACDC